MYTIHLDAIDSTNTYAKTHRSLFPPHQISCVYADEQTAGRGRQQRNWISPKGVNLYVTFFLQLPSNTLHLTAIGQVLALSSASVLLKHRFAPRIKWPNDLQLRGKKVAGILCETTFHSPLVDLFLGIGINVNMEPELLKQIDQPATSLFAETGRIWDKETLLEELKTTFAKDVEIFKKQGFTPFWAHFDELLALKGQTIRCFDGETHWTGICQGISPDGRLKLELPSREIKLLSSGDIQDEKIW